MRINETYQRSVRIEGAPDDLNGYKMTIKDLESGEEIENITDCTITLTPRRLNAAYLTYDDQGKVVADEYKEPMQNRVRVDNPEVAITALEEVTDAYKNHN